MVNEERVRQMTKLEICDKKIGAEQFRISSYYRHDYIRLQQLKTIVATTIAYLIALLGIGMIKMEYLLEHLQELDYKKLGTIIGIVYLVFLLVFFFISRSVASKKYDKAYRFVRKYRYLLRELQELYEIEGTSLEEKERGGQKIDDNRFADF